VEHFADRLVGAIRRRGNPVLVGLDPRLDSLPPSVRGEVERESDPDAVAAAYWAFCREVIDVVAPLVPAVKPQMAFFEQWGPPGMQALAQVIAYAHQHDLLVIVDGKRNDIGTTAAGYASGYLGCGTSSVWGGDALTVSPYLGADSVEPFVATACERGGGVFVLVKTSNPGGGLFQDLMCGALPLYRHVAAFVEQLAERTKGSAGYGAVGAVAGATYPEQLAELRQAMPHSWFLVPGFGTQGAAARDVRSAFHDDGLGAIVNNSRGIIFAHARPEYRDRFGATQWQRAVEQATVAMIDQLRADTPAGQLG